MFLIALSGGESADRERIADCLVVSGKSRLASYAMYPPVRSEGARKLPPLDGPARMKHLAEVVEGLEGQSPVSGGLVIVHCLTFEEAKLIRESGGEVWHVYGSSPSSLVPIARADRMVTPEVGGFGHVLTPLEALSEYLLSMGRAKRRCSHG